MGLNSCKLAASWTGWRCQTPGHKSTYNYHTFNFIPWYNGIYYIILTMVFILAGDSEHGVNT